MQPKVNNVIDFEIFLFFLAMNVFSIVLNIIHVIFEKKYFKNNSFDTEQILYVFFKGA